MLKLSQTEIFNKQNIISSAGLETTGVQSSLIKNALQKLEAGVGVVKLDQLSVPIETLRSNYRNNRISAFPLLGRVLNGLDNGTLIPFCLDEGSVIVTSYIPLIIGKGKVYVNLLGLGSWRVESDTFAIPSNLLYAALESGYIALAMQNSSIESRISSDNTVLEYSTKIYINLFTKVMEKTFKAYPNDVIGDIANFLIGKFFLIHVFEKPESGLVDDIAYKASKAKTSMKTIEAFESDLSIDFSSLSKFLGSLIQGIYGDQNKPDAAFIDFVSGWVAMYAYPMFYAPEFYLYLIYFLFSAMEGGVVSRLYKFKDKLDKDTAILYNAITRIIS